CSRLASASASTPACAPRPAAAESVDEKSISRPAASESGFVSAAPPRPRHAFGSTPFRAANAAALSPPSAVALVSGGGGGPDAPGLVDGLVPGVVAELPLASVATSFARCPWIVTPSFARSGTPSDEKRSISSCRPVMTPSKPNLPQQKRTRGGAFFEPGTV